MSEHATKLLEIVRLFISAVGFGVSLFIWLFFRGAPKALAVDLRQMFGSVALVLFVASIANLVRVAYGTNWFLQNVFFHTLLLVLYAAMTGTAVRFAWHLYRR